MVKIINGEIVSDDDPRLRQPQQPLPPGPGHPGSQPGGSGGAGDAGGAGGVGGAGGAGGTGFSLSASPLRFVDAAPGVTPLMGLPDAEILGVRVTPYAILVAVGLGMFMGWRGVVVALVLYYVYLVNQNVGPRAPEQVQPGSTQPGRRPSQQPPQHQQQQQQPQQQGNSPMDMLNRYMDGPKPRSRAGAPAVDAGGGQGAAGSVGADGWAAFQGRGNKLGGK